MRLDRAGGDQHEQCDHRDRSGNRRQDGMIERIVNLLPRAVPPGVSRPVSGSLQPLWLFRFCTASGHYSGREIGMTERSRCHSCCLRSALLPRREGGVNARHYARDGTGVCRHLHTEPLRQYGVVHGAGCCDPDHPVRHCIAPIYPADPRFRAQRGVYARGLRWLLSLWHRRRPMARRIAALGVTPGKRVSDVRSFVEKIRSYDGIGALPPIVLAALRKKMVALAAEIGRASSLRTPASRTCRSRSLRFPWSPSGRIARSSAARSSCWVRRIGSLVIIGP